MEEIERLGPMVDQVRFFKVPEPNKFVFKYCFVEQRSFFIWNEMQLWMRLPKHPHILMAVVDELNLNLGITHQDVAPRNLLIDEKTDSLMIFDFNFSARIGDERYTEPRNDIKGVFFTMYEMITLNKIPRAVRLEDLKMSDIEDRKWELHPDVQLDHPVSEFRAALAQWSKRRRQGEHITFYKGAPNYIDWPDRPASPLPEPVYEGTDGPPVTEMRNQGFKRRAQMLEDGEAVPE
ncbi:hypothetical protein N3K66_005288 [Trichothecium roseum]|uniref:Uncharacterized protein n=1 Tax=Trichothecium roseum TaxID=47278 RepID=A0ACC0UZ45_9HYPO|nr:hypothetical protein N3K66_005288 [Trichothecium roseum]